MPDKKLWYQTTEAYSSSEIKVKSKNLLHTQIQFFKKDSVNNYIIIIVVQ